jgi:hypothetical protein
MTPAQLRRASGCTQATPMLTVSTVAVPDPSCGMSSARTAASTSSPMRSASGRFTSNRMIANSSPP